MTNIIQDEGDTKVNKTFYALKEIAFSGNNGQFYPALQFLHTTYYIHFSELLLSLQNTCYNVLQINRRESRALEN